MSRYTHVILLIMCPLTVWAEHLFEAGARFGMAGYNAECEYVLPAPNLHAGALLSYSFRSPYIIGFRFGGTIDRHTAGLGKIDYTDSYKTIDVDNENIQVDYTIGRLIENYTLWSAGLMLQLGLSFEGVNLYVGPKLVFPFGGNWTERADKAELSVYFPKQDNRVYESFPLAATRSFSERQTGIVKKQEKQWWVSAEVSYDIPIYIARRHRAYISVGVYADYSFASETDSQSDRISLLMLSDTRDGFPLHRIMTTVVSGNRQGQKLVEKRNLYDVGIKVAYRITPYNPLKRNMKDCRCLIFD